MSLETWNRDSADTQSESCSHRRNRISSLSFHSSYCAGCFFKKGRWQSHLWQCMESPLTVHRSVRLIGGECSKQQHIPHLKGSWAVGSVEFFGIFLFFTTPDPICSTQLGSRNKAKYKRREGALLNPRQKFLKEIELLQMNRILPTQVFACLALCLLFVCLVFLAQLFT